jgi:hypothetical protein
MMRGFPISFVKLSNVISESTLPIRSTGHVR